MINPMQALANMVVMLNDEVFARKPSNPNKPLKKASHPAHTLIMIDDFKFRVIPASVSYTWGLTGASDETTTTPQAGRWSVTAHWGA